MKLQTIQDVISVKETGGGCEKQSQNKERDPVESA